VFMFLAGTNFVLHYYAMRGQIRSYFKSEEFRFYFFITLIMIPIFTLVLAVTHMAESPVRDAAFQVVSILTTTGFTTADFDLWPVFLRFSLILLMFIGGCGGSTGGGLKVVRVFISIKMAWYSMIQAIYPNAVLPIKMDGNPIPSKLTIGVLSYFFIFILLFLVGTLALTVTE